MCEMTFGWPVEMLVKSARARYRIAEVPLHYRKRKAGKSKVAGTLVGSVRAAWSMLHTTFRYAGRRQALPVSSQQSSDNFALLGQSLSDQIGEEKSAGTVALFGTRDASLELDERQKRLFAR